MNFQNAAIVKLAVIAIVVCAAFVAGYGISYYQQVRLAEATDNFDDLDNVEFVVRIAESLDSNGLERTRSFVLASAQAKLASIKMREKLAQASKWSLSTMESTASIGTNSEMIAAVGKANQDAEQSIAARLAKLQPSTARQ